MLETAQTAPALLTGRSDTARSAQPALLTVRTQIALLAIVVALAVSFGAAQDFTKITNLACGLVTKLSAPVLLGAAGTIVVLMFGWNKLMGEQNAFQSLKNGVIGGIIILAAGTIATALFGSGCTVAVPPIP
ncbi:TrbC/VirB2 family protein [Deinococcus arenicola]|uniref:Conjugal transfer protein TrbC n=1 Tax=Deinococcus arenicola TaxID=2994950 RepID=A0ABU4DV99_9DEIO|nr:TrbC/VirB2 family protein [Deinococcus sp. ZS9-10]MDV6376346.1 hypothetical protein [Deinococcus sp. ZS9-10]